jgi:hypothetical protein
LETNFSKAVIVVAPKCPAELIRELLGANFLPRQTQFDVLLPSRNTGVYDQLIEEHPYPGSARIISSPGGSFFSPGHLYWLWQKVRVSENTMVLVADSPHQDPVTALTALSVLAMAGKTVTLLFATPEAFVDVSGQNFTERWLARDLNARVLLKELRRLFWVPLYVLYFLMFGGLVVRKKVTDYLASLSESENPATRIPDRNYAVRHK